MISIKKLISVPKDGNEMVSRKTQATPFRVAGVVINKKSAKAYNIEILMDEEMLTLDSNVKVSCSCHDFKFRWAYVLYKQDALLKPNEYVLEPPKVTNPDHNINACKHLHKFMSDERDRTLKSFSKKLNQL